MPDTTFFRETLLFGELPEDALERIVDEVDDRDLQRGDIIFREDDPPDELYIVLSGRIAIVNKSIDGRESMVALMVAAVSESVSHN